MLQASDSIFGTNNGTLRINYLACCNTEVSIPFHSQTGGSGFKILNPYFNPAALLLHPN